MLASSTLRFLKQLKQNNHKDWMDAHRQEYLQAKADFENFGTNVLHKMVHIDSGLAGLAIKDCTFRINRDVRFSANKAPYKTNMALYLAMGGKKSTAAGYYCHIEPGNSFIAGGVWMPMPPVLKLIRQEIDYNFDTFKKMITNPSFVKTFGNLEKGEGTMLSRPPKGYEADNAAIEYIKMKSYIASVPLQDSVLTKSEVIDTVVKLFTQLKPLVGFLNEAQHNEG